VLDALLRKYTDAGIRSVESMDILRVDPQKRFGTPVEIIGIFGGREAYLEAVREMESALYDRAA